MPKSRLRTDILPMSPLSLRCPFCDTEPGRDCSTTSGGFSVVHVMRVKKAATMDALNGTRKSDRRI